MVPPMARYVIVGAGVHGLSTAWHLARALRASGQGSGDDVVVVDKTGPGAGASGIACGVVRNNYFQPAMRRLMAHSVSVWEDHAETLSYHPVGYLQISPEVMRDGVSRIYAEQRAISYPSTLVEGAGPSRDYLRDLFGDWRAEGITSVLHEKRGGYANNLASVRGLAALAQSEGVRLHTGVEVTGVQLDGGAVTAVDTDHGVIRCEHLVVAVGPWISRLWAMLDLPPTVTVRPPRGTTSGTGGTTDGTGGTTSGAASTSDERPMWRYWMLQEGTVGFDPSRFTDNRGEPPPVTHVDSDAPLYDEDGDLVTDQLWGIYYKPDPAFGGVQGGCMPRPVDEPADEVAVDPYGPASQTYRVDGQFVRMWTAALAHCHERFAGVRRLYTQEPSGGLGCFTPDSFPVFDTFRQNAYVIADSNHGYKMVGVGALVTAELLGEPPDLLAPFRFARYERGEPHPTSASPFPWS
ncbi:MAG: NAD(P)/FAD-dependent oxidoreductase [Micromonosporaceae bacterium]